MTAIFAHRGCHGEPGPGENTIEAFLAARHAHADGVELDVHATADGALAVRHDRHVPGAGDVTNLSFAELPADTPQLGEALDACAGMQVNVELKGAAADAVLAARLLIARGRAGATPPGVFVSSFDAASLAAAREAAPGLPLGLLVDWRTGAEDAVREAKHLGCSTLHPFVSQVDAALVEAAARAGLGLHVWTVNHDADLVAMGSLGVEAVITDRVVAAVRLLRPGSGDEPGRSGSDDPGPPQWNGGEQAG